MHLGILEIILIQIIIYSSVFLVNSYVGFLLCLIIGCIAIAIMIFSLIVEVIEKSKVPKSYYRYMATACIVPFIVILIFSIFEPNTFQWLNE